jgi:hypothetical protein
MNIPRPEHLEAQYIFREFGGYIFKLPKNKDLAYQSIETQEYYYWTLAELAYHQQIDSQTTNTSITAPITQVSGWQIPTGTTDSTQPVSRYIQLPELKKQQKDKLIVAALAKVYSNTYGQSAQPSSFQYIETVSPN